MAIDDEVVVLVPSPSGLKAGSHEDFLRRFGQARTTVIGALRRLPEFADALAGLQKDRKFTIEWPAGIREAVENGRANWRQYADGTYSVVIRDGANKDIVKHLRLKREDLPVDAVKGFSGMALQSALADISQKIEELDAKLDKLAIGASAERIGRVIAARDVYQQARVATSDETRRLLLGAAIQTAAEARAVLLKNIQLRVEALEVPALASQWMKSVPFMDTPSEKFGDELVALTDEFKAALVATQLMADVHSAAGEDAMARVAVEQFNASVAVLAPRFASLLRFAPRARVEHAETLWSGVSQRLLPASLGAQRMLSSSTLSFELDAEALTE